MEIKITRINSLSAALSIAAVSFILTLLWSILAAIALSAGIQVDTEFNAIFTVASAGGVFPWLLLVASPFLAYITTFISTYIICAVYNFVTSYTGPISITTKD